MIECNTAQCDTILQYNTMRCDAMQFNTVHGTSSTIYGTMSTNERTNERASEQRNEKGTITIYVDSDYT